MTQTKTKLLSIRMNPDEEKDLRDFIEVLMKQEGKQGSWTDYNISKAIKSSLKLSKRHLELKARLQELFHIEL